MSMKQIRILIDEARRSYPIEACGALFGELSGDEACIKRIVVFKNTLKSTVNFQINPEEYLKALFEAEEEGLQHIGFFHSHPASPHPSIMDIKYMKLWPETIWLIISSTSNEVAAYRIKNGDLQRIHIDMKMEKMLRSA